MMMLKTKNGPLIPALRFPEFENEKEWEEKRFTKCFDFISNNSLSRDKLSYEIGEIYNIHYGDIHKIFSNQFKLKHEKVPLILPVYASARTMENKMVREGDLVIADASEDIDGIGKGIAVIDTAGEKIVAGLHTIHARRTCNCLYSSFAGYWLCSLHYRKQVEREAQGAKVLGISSRKVANFIIPIPTLLEQQKIADCLSSIDDLIGAESEKLEAYKKHKKGLMQKLFPVEGKTIPALRFPEFRDSGAWEERKLGEIADIKTGTSNRQDSTTNGGQYVFFDRSQDIRTSNNFLFDSEAIIIGGEGKKFKPKYFCGKFDLHQRAYATMNFQASVGLFLYYCIDFFGDAYFQSQAVGSTVKSLRLPMFQTMPISLPPKDEQQKIADCLSSIDDLITAQTEIIKQLSKHKKGLMQKLFPSLKEENNE